MALSFTGCGNNRASLEFFEALNSNKSSITEVVYPLSLSLIMLW